MDYTTKAEDNNVPLNLAIQLQREDNTQNHINQLLLTHSNVSPAITATPRVSGKQKLRGLPGEGPQGWAHRHQGCSRERREDTSDEGEAGTRGALLLSEGSRPRDGELEQRRAFGAT